MSFERIFWLREKTIKFSLLKKKKKVSELIVSFSEGNILNILQPIFFLKNSLEFWKQKLILYNIKPKIENKIQS